jgi:hypothetical protein
MFYIELQFVYVPTGIILVQKRYAVVLLARFNTMECQPTTNPMEERIQL